MNDIKLWLWGRDLGCLEIAAGKSSCKGPKYLADPGSNLLNSESSMCLKLVVLSVCLMNAM
jgi:hypothetical protein